MVVWLIETFGGSEFGAYLLFNCSNDGTGLAGDDFFAAVYFGSTSGASFCPAAFILSGSGLCFLERSGSIASAGSSWGFDFETARSFSQHPIIFLLLFCNWQIVNLALGAAMYRKSLSGGFKAP